MGASLLMTGLGLSAHAQTGEVDSILIGRVALLDVGEQLDHPGLLDREGLRR